MTLRRTILGLELEIPEPTVEYTEHGEGLEHVDDTLARMGELALEGAEDWRIRELAVRTLRAADVAPKDARGAALAVYRFAEQHVLYVADPLHIEWIQRPLYTLVSGAGDCDDIATLIAAMLATIGIPFRFRTIGPGGADKPEHVHVEAMIAPDGQWVSLDPVLAPDGGAPGDRIPGDGRIYGESGRFTGMVAGATLGHCCTLANLPEIPAVTTPSDGQIGLDPNGVPVEWSAQRRMWVWHG
ncbi:MAG: transglutaminase-like domain-containing protein [Polyangiales bacterium]